MEDRLHWAMSLRRGPLPGAYRQRTSCRAANCGVSLEARYVRSGEIVPGRWNFGRLPQAVPLSIATSYQLATGTLGGVPRLVDQPLVIGLVPE